MVLRSFKLILCRRNLRPSLAKLAFREGRKSEMIFSRLLSSRIISLQTMMLLAKLKWSLTPPLRQISPLLSASAMLKRHVESLFHANFHQMYLHHHKSYFFVRRLLNTFIWSWSCGDFSKSFRFKKLFRRGLMMIVCHCQTEVDV